MRLCKGEGVKVCVCVREGGREGSLTLLVAASIARYEQCRYSTQTQRSRITHSNTADTHTHLRQHTHTLSKTAHPSW